MGVVKRLDLGVEEHSAISIQPPAFSTWHLAFVPYVGDPSFLGFRLDWVCLGVANES